MAFKCQQHTVACIYSKAILCTSSEIRYAEMESFKILYLHGKTFSGGVGKRRIIKKYYCNKMVLNCVGGLHEVGDSQERAR